MKQIIQMLESELNISKRKLVQIIMALKRQENICFVGNNIIEIERQVKLILEKMNLSLPIERIDNCSTEQKNQFFNKQGIYIATNKENKSIPISIKSHMNFILFD